MIDIGSSLVLQWGGYEYSVTGMRATVASLAKRSNALAISCQQSGECYDFSVPAARDSVAVFRFGNRTLFSSQPLPKFRFLLVPFT
jgi:hypothetical protein